MKESIYKNSIFSRNQIREKGWGIESKLTEEYTPLAHDRTEPNFRS